MSMNGDPDGPPMKSNPFANDYVTALFALWSALAAYISVLRTGRGQVVDVAQYECQFKLLACAVMDYLMLGKSTHGPATTTRRACSLMVSIRPEMATSASGRSGDRSSD